MLTPSSQEVEGGGFEQVKFVRDIQEKVISGMRWPEKAEALAAADEGENEEEEGRGGGGRKTTRIMMKRRMTRTVTLNNVFAR